MQQELSLHQISLNEYKNYVPSFMVMCGAPSPIKDG